MTKSASPCMLITGASSGIGYATAEYFVNRSWTVYGLSRSGKVPNGVNALLADVADADAVQRAVFTLMETTGRLDAVVNAAGIGGASSLEHFPLAKAEQLFATNILGTLTIIQATLPHLRDRERGTFIAISSIAGLLGVPFHGVYSASKFAVEGLIESLRLELTGTNVHAVSICPGDTATPIISHQFRAKSEDLPVCYRENYAKAEQAMRESVAEGIPPVRIAETIDQIIYQRAPSGRYVIGGVLQKIAPTAKRWLPKSWFEKVMKKYYGLS